MENYKLLNFDVNNTSQVEKWNDFLKVHPEGHHHSSHFIKMLTATYNLKNESMMVVDESNGNVKAILPLILTKSPIFKNHLTSLPFLNYGGIISVDDIAEDLLVQKAMEKGQSNKCETVSLRYSEPSAYLEKVGCSLETHKANMVLQLPQEMKDVGAGNAKKKGKLRSQASLALRKSESDGLPLEQKFGHLELLSDFYLVMSTHMRDLGSPVHSKKLFGNALIELKENAILTVCYLNNKPVSCGFLINHGHRMSIPWASCLKEANPYSMNTYMYWNILEFTINKKVGLFDFGRSTINEGTYKFKAQWGAEPQTCYWYNILSKNKVSSASVKADDYGLAVKIWKRIPLSVANYFGPKLVKSIP